MKKSTGINFKLSHDSATWDMTWDENPKHGIFSSTCNLEVNGNIYSLNEADQVSRLRKSTINDHLETRTSQPIEFTFLKPGFKWLIWFETHHQSNSLIIHGNIENISKKPLTLGKCRLIDINTAGRKPAQLNFGEKHENLTVIPFNDSLATQYVKRISCGESVHEARQALHLHDPATGATLLAGYLTFDRMVVTNELCYSRRKGILSYENYCDFYGYELLPGKTITSEKLLVEISDNPYSPLEHWADLVNSVYKPPIKDDIPVGWVGCSWVDILTTEIPENIIERNTLAIQKRLAGFGIDYLWISIVNLKDGLPGNWLEFNQDYFPNGVENTLKKLKKRGFKPGFWVAPFYIVAKNAVKGNWDNLLKGKDGKPRKIGNWLWAAKAKEGELPPIYLLDGSHPESLKYIANVFRKYRDLGIRYYMIDFLRAPVPEDRHYDKTMINGTEVYRNLLKTVRKTAGPDTHLLTASGPTMKNIGINNSCRIGMDYGEGRHLMPRFSSYPANFVISGAQGSAGNPNHNALQNLATGYFMHRRFFINNSNMLTIDKPIPLNEAIISTTLFGISGSPIMLGDDIDTISDERLKLIKKILPRTQDTAFPVDLFRRVYPENYTRVFKVNIKKTWGNWLVLAVFNLDDQPVSINISGTELNLDENTRYRLYDFWNERYCGLISSNFAVEVPASSCRLLRLEKVKNHPWILSTDMHVRQGQVELDKVKWNARKMTLEGVAIRPKGEEGNLYLVAPDGYKLKDFNKGLFVAKSMLDGSLIIRKRINFKTKQVPWKIEFEKMTKKELEWRKKGK